jgi:hypothetical protein
MKWWAAFCLSGWITGVACADASWAWLHWTLLAVSLTMFAGSYIFVMKGERI